MIKLSGIIMSLICLCQCSHRNAGISKSEVTKITVVYKVPSLYTSDSSILAVDSSCIYYYKKYKVHEFPLLQGHFEESGFVLDSTTVAYVGYDTTKRVGFKIENLNNPQMKQINLDSFMRTRPTASTLPELLKNATFGKEIKISNNIISKRYTLNYEATDSLFLYFDKSLADIPFSFSPLQDSINKSKLSRIELTLKKDTSINANQFNQFRKVSWDLRKSTDDKSFADIIALCKKMEDLYNKQEN